MPANKQATTAILCLLLSMGQAHAQVAFHDLLGSQLSPTLPGIDSPPPDDWDQFFVRLYSSGTLGLRTWQKGRVIDDYREIANGLAAGYRITPRLTFLVSGELSSGTGSFNSGGSIGNGLIVGDSLSLSLAAQIAPKVSLTAGYSRSQDDLTLNSNLLGTDLPALGTNPVITASSDNLSFPLGVDWNPIKPLGIDFRWARLLTTGNLSAQPPSGQPQLVIPIDPDGAQLSARASWHEHSVGGSLQALTSYASSTGGLTAPGTTVGQSGVESHQTLLGASVYKAFRKTGKFTLEYQNSQSRASFDAFDPNPTGLGLDLPSGATADVSGQVSDRRTEVGLSWDSPNQLWNVTYRQVKLPFFAGGQYGANLYLLTLGESGSVNYSAVDLGVISLQHKFRLKRADLVCTLQQVIPYRLTNVSVSHTTGPPSPSSTSIGGTTLAIELTVKR